MSEKETKKAEGETKPPVSETKATPGETPKPATAATATPTPTPKPAVCVMCDETPLDAAMLEAGKDTCEACEVILKGQPKDPSDEPIEQTPEDLSEELPPLPPRVLEAMEAFGLDRAHVLSYRIIGGKHNAVNITTQGGRKVQLRTENAGTPKERDVLVTWIGSQYETRWVESPLGGFVARDEKNVLITLKGADGKDSPFRVKHGREILHDRDRGVKQEPLADVGSIFKANAAR